MKLVRTIIAIIWLCMIALPAFAQQGGSQNIQQWQAAPGYVNSIQNQINAINAKLQGGTATFPTGAAGQALGYAANGTAASPFSFTLDLSCSTTTLGQCSVIGDHLSLPNASSGGTVVNNLTSLTGAPSTAIRTTHASTSGVIGITSSGAGTSGNAQITTFGTTSCVYDGATTAGDYVQISPTVDGNCHDAGSGFPASGQIIGFVLSTNGGAGTYNTYLFAPGTGQGAAVSGAQNLVFATPNGSSGNAALRALVNADLPASGASAGTYTNVTATVNAQGIVTAISTGSTSANGVNANIGQTTVSGTTAGSCVMEEYVNGSAQKQVDADCAGYENTTSTAQTEAFTSLSSGASFTTVATITNNCDPPFSTSTTTLTFPASMAATISCHVRIVGY